MVLFDQINIILIVIASTNLFLAVAVFLNGRRQKINIVYSLITLSIIAWVVSMIMYRSAPQETALFWGQMLYVSATLIASTFLYFTYIFPTQREKSITGKSVLIFLANAAIVAMIADGRIISAVNVRSGLEKEIIFTGYYWFYFFYIFALFTLGFGRLYQKYKTTTGVERMQALYVFFGYSITGNLAFVTNLIMPWIGLFFLNWLGQVFTLIIVTFTTYAIVKHRLFNLKVVATEILTLLLVIVTLAQVLTAGTQAEIIYKSLIFIAIVSFSLLLIKSEIKEIKQREQLEDLTQKLATANTQLKELDKARAEFISVASHQLRTPPATIKWYLAAILGGDFGPVTDKIKSAIGRAEMTNNSLISLIDDLLNASRIERGKMEFIFEPTDVVKITQITVDQLMPQALQKKQTLSFSPPTGIPLATMDKEKIRQVINNLIDNAIKYTDPGGKINVEVMSTPKDITVKVTDNGKGIAKSEIGTVFQKYNRGGNKTDSQGLGLGLYVAKVVVEQHRGKIWAESKGLGKGTTFCVRLPIKTNLKAASFDFVHR